MLGVWPLHGLCGAWGGIAAGIFGSEAFKGRGSELETGFSFMSQLTGTLIGVAIALAGGLVIYGIVKKTMGIRLSQEEEYEGADLSIHKIASESSYEK